MKRLRAKLKSSKFVRDTLFLQSSTALDAFTGVVVLVALARGLGKEGYGSWAQVVRIQEFLTLFLSVGIVQATLSRLPAAVQAADRERVLEILAFFAKASILITGWAALAAALAAPFVAQYAFGIRGEDVWWIGGLSAAMVLSLPIGIPARLVSTALQGSRRMEELSYIENYSSIVRTIATLIGVALAVTSPEDAHQPLIYVVGARLLASLFNSWVSVFLYRRWQSRYTERDRVDVILPTLTEIAMRARTVRLGKDLWFSIWIGLDKNIATLVGLVPFMALGWVVDDARQKEATGLFHMAMRLLEFPMKALGAVSRNTLIKLGERRGARDHEGFFKVLGQVTLASGLYSVVVISTFALFAPWIVAWLPGSDYAPCVEYLRILAIYAAISGFGTGLGSVFNVYERIGASIAIKLVGVAIALPLGLHLTTLLADPVQAICWFHIIQMALITSFAFLYIYLRLRPRDPFAARLPAP